MRILIEEFNDYYVIEVPLAFESASMEIGLNQSIFSFFYFILLFIVLNPLIL